MGSGEWQTVVGRRQRRAPQLLGVEQEQAQAQGKRQGAEKHAAKSHPSNGELVSALAAETEANSGHAADRTSSIGIRAGRAEGAQGSTALPGSSRDSPGSSPLPLPGWGPVPGRRKARSGRASKATPPASGSAHSSSAHCSHEPAVRGRHPEPGSKAVENGRTNSRAAERDGSREPPREAAQSTQISDGEHCGESFGAGARAGANGFMRGSHREATARAGRQGASQGARPGEVSAILRRVQEAK